jgi:hypothetical protein
MAQDWGLYRLDWRALGESSRLELAPGVSSAQAAADCRITDDSTSLGGRIQAPNVVPEGCEGTVPLGCRFCHLLVPGCAIGKATAFFAREILIRDKKLLASWQSTCPFLFDGKYSAYEHREPQLQDT